MAANVNAVAAAAAQAAAIVAAAVAEAAELDTALEYIGFPTGAERLRIATEAFLSFTELTTLSETAIHKMCDDFIKRSVANGRIQIPLRRRNMLIAMMHWTQDFVRCSEVPSLDGITTEQEYLAALAIAIEREKIRKNDAKTCDTLSAASSPGSLKSNVGWSSWHENLEHHLSFIPGCTGVPISYVIRLEPDPTPDGHTSFTMKTIACAALTGTAFNADSRTVHQIVTSLVKGELANSWVKPVAKQECGRVDIVALRAHFAGSGNENRRLKDAEKMQKTLHYKNERAMTYDQFLTKIQEMFTIFEECGQPMYDKQKLDFLFERTQHPDLKQHISTLEVKRAMEDCEFDFAANFLAGKAVELANPVSGFGRSISAITTNAGKGPEGAGCMMPDGSVFTGTYERSKWQALSGTDKDKVNAARGKAPYQHKSRKTSATARKVQALASVKATIAEGKKEVKQLHRQVSALKRQYEANSSQLESEEEEKHDQAGLSFGGKEEMHTKKKAKSVQWIKKGKD